MKTKTPKIHTFAATLRPAPTWCCLAIALILTTASFRTLGDTLTVTNLADSGPGSLRDRIAASANGDTIEFGILGTITLNSELVITNNLDIDGAGADVHRISGNNSSRVLHIAGLVTIEGITISDGRVVGTTGPEGLNGENVRGGGILVDNASYLALINCVVSNHVVVGGQGGSQSQFGTVGNGGNGFGGAIANYGTLFMNQSRLYANSASGGDSGPISDGFPGTGGQGWGGVLYSEGTAQLWRCTADANHAIAGAGPGAPGGAGGGGIYNVASLDILACTVVSNAATGGSFDTGGGIDNYGTLTIADSTISGNAADFGGGITGGNLANTILAGNSATSSGPDGSGSITSSDYNFIQDTNGLTLSGTTTHNITGQEPLLGPLQDNGSVASGLQTLTMAPLPGSPVIDQGNSATSDQRGEARPHDTNIPDAPGGNGADIGAVEFSEDFFWVLNNNDSGPGSLRQAVLDNSALGGGYDIEFASNVTGTITLTSGELVVNDQVRILGPGAEGLAISANQNGRVFNVINGLTEIRDLTLRDGLVVGSAGGSGQTGQDGRGGAIFNQSILRVRSCDIVSNIAVGGMGGPGTSGSAGGGGRGLGGGIYNAAGDLDVAGCTFEGNECIGGQGGTSTTGSAGFAGNGLGGGVCSIGGTAEIRRSNFANNQATGGAGGIATEDGSPGNGGQGYGGGFYSESETELSYNTIHNSTAQGGSGGGGNGAGDGGGIYNLDDLSVFTCTIVSNRAAGSPFDSGGGIASFGTLAITNSTIVGNQADFGGGLSGNASLANTILAGNSAASFGPDGSGTITSQDFNLIQDTNGLSIMGATTHLIIGLDPMLGPLTNNGSSTLIMPLLVGSPAIDQGHSFGATIDQRFGDRPFDFPEFPNAAGGDGSDIGAFELGVPELLIQNQPPNVALYWSGAYDDVILEATTTAPPVTGWSTVTNEVLAGEQNVVVDSASADTKFYRLRSR